MCSGAVTEGITVKTRSNYSALQLPAAINMCIVAETECNPYEHMCLNDSQIAEVFASLLMLKGPLKLHRNSYRTYTYTITLAAAH